MFNASPCPSKLRTRPHNPRPSPRSSYRLFLPTHRTPTAASAGAGWRGRLAAAGGGARGGAEEGGGARGGQGGGSGSGGRAGRGGRRGRGRGGGGGSGGRGEGGGVGGSGRRGAGGAAEWAGGSAGSGGDGGDIVRECMWGQGRQSRRRGRWRRRGCASTARGRRGAAGRGLRYALSGCNGLRPPGPRASRGLCPLCELAMPGALLICSYGCWALEGSGLCAPGSGWSLLRPGCSTRLSASEGVHTDLCSTLICFGARPSCYAYCTTNYRSSCALGVPDQGSSMYTC